MQIVKKCLEYVWRWTKHRPVIGMPTPRLDKLPTTSGHAPDQTTNGTPVNGNSFLSYFNKGLNSLWRVLDAETRLGSISHKCSIGFKSEDRAGHSITLIPSWSRYPMTDLAVCGRALSCISMKSGPTATAKGLTTGCKNRSHYLTAVRAPLSRTCKFVRSSKQMPTHTITEPPPYLSYSRTLQSA